MNTLVLRIEYDGSDFGGWQFQKNAPTIQESLEKAIGKICGQRFSATGAGRTDAGVHARGQVASILLDDFLFPVPEKKIPLAVNKYLPKAIRINAAKILDYQFNARFDAIGREYSYTISTRFSVFSTRFSTYIKYPIDEQLLLKSSDLFIGLHDFTTFSKNNEETKSYVCSVEKCEWEKIDQITYRLHFRADRFVYGMVRACTGAMIDIARARKSIEQVTAELQQCDRRFISPLQPPQGLVLEEVFYGEGWGF